MNERQKKALKGIIGCLIAEALIITTVLLKNNCDSEDFKLKLAIILCIALFIMNIVIGLIEEYGFIKLLFFSWVEGVLLSFLFSFLLSLNGAQNIFLIAGSLLVLIFLIINLIKIRKTRYEKIMSDVEKFKQQKTDNTEIKDE